MASVNNEGISREDYQKKLLETKNFLTYKEQAIASDSSVTKDVLESMVGESLISQFAQEHKIIVTEAEIHSRYLQIVAGFNRNNKVIGSGDGAFLAKIKEMYDIDKNTYLLQVKMDLLKEKVQASVKMPLVKWLESEKQKAHIQTNL